MKENSEGLRNSKEKGNFQKQEGVWDKFKKLLRKKALKLVLDRKFYTNSSKCQICKKKIERPSYPYHFHLYTNKERIQFITFHFKCALKKGKVKELNELIQYFNFIGHFNRENKKMG